MLKRRTLLGSAIGLMTAMPVALIGGPAALVHEASSAGPPTFFVPRTVTALQTWLEGNFTVVEGPKQAWYELDAHLAKEDRDIALRRWYRTYGWQALGEYPWREHDLVGLMFANLAEQRARACFAERRLCPLLVVRRPLQLTVAGAAGAKLTFRYDIPSLDDAVLEAAAVPDGAMPHDAQTWQRGVA